MKRREKLWSKPRSLRARTQLALHRVSLRKILSIDVHSWKPSLNQIVYISNRIKKMSRTPSAPLTILVQEMTLFCIYLWMLAFGRLLECAKKKRKRRPWKNRTQHRNIEMRSISNMSNELSFYNHKKPRWRIINDQLFLAWSTGGMSRPTVWSVGTELQVTYW